ncbi:unnamed protein product, partial [Polarella glacialis]
LSTGDIKVWDTSSWAEIEAIRGDGNEGIESLAVSHGPQHWLASAQPSSLQVFSCESPFDLAWSMQPAEVEGLALKGRGSRWVCASFSPEGLMLAAASSGHVCAIDYSKGWNPGACVRQGLSRSAKGIMAFRCLDDARYHFF